MYHPDLFHERWRPEHDGGRWQSPQACPALVLNADYTPLSYYPLSLWSWQDAIKAAFLERVDVIAQYDREIRSPSFAMRLPSVVALRQYVKPSQNPAFTRFNLFLRDRFTCQYCGTKEDLTFDHVVPRAYGGRTTWTNVTTACAPCNLRKGGRTPAEAHMLPRQRPFQPTSHQLQENGRGFPPHYCHETWRDYLYWDSELEA
jgi:5-methylcytosine-specific restriction endonuclease McrA